MKRGLQGIYLPIPSHGEKARAFKPHPLPPKPEIQFDKPLQFLLAKAHEAIGRLDGISAILPDPLLFYSIYLRKEAVLSSMIEGTQSTITDVLQFELDMDSDPDPGVKEVVALVKALEHGISALNDGGQITNRLIKELHSILMEGARGNNLDRGEFRRSQNWIGGTRPGNASFVPPLWEDVPECMGDLEDYINNESDIAPIIKAALVHIQFETIHPFLDGNGRIGRLLITLVLLKEMTISHPSLYLSLYFKSFRNAYYEALSNLRQDGDWEKWIEFFLQAVKFTAEQAVVTAKELRELIALDTEALKKHSSPRQTLSVIYSFFTKHLVGNVYQISVQTKLSQPTVNKALAVLRELEIIRELTGQKRNRIFIYGQYIDILDRGTEFPD